MIQYALDLDNILHIILIVIKVSANQKHLYQVLQNTNEMVQREYYNLGKRFTSNGDIMQTISKES